jgi:hypothetical protein
MQFVRTTLHLTILATISPAGGPLRNKKAGSLVDPAFGELAPLTAPVRFFKSQ